MLAKSHPRISLLDHSNLVYENTKIIIDKLYPFINDFGYEDDKEQILLSALLHDIGKSTDNFQSLLNNEDYKERDKYSHNAISWAMVSRYLKGNKFYILDLIYWHHGVKQLVSISNEEVINSLSEKDIESVIKSMKSLVGDDKINEESESNKVSSPLYLNTDSDFQLENKIIYRNILILADRLTSKYNTLLNEDILNEFYNKESVSDYIISSDTCIKRLNIQRDIVDTINKEDKATTSLNASAGFGKTMLGLLWALPKKKKLIWVAPRNSIIESLYESINNDLKRLGVLDKVKVQTYYSNKVINGDSDLFDADIIITNIDTLLNQNFNNSKLINLALINTCNVVMDEWHEFVCDSPLFPFWVTMMRVRNMKTKAKTLLLSATPINLDSLLTSKFNKSTHILHLPNKYEHFNAQHNKKYSLNFTPIPEVNDNTISIFNAIKTTQNNFIENGNYNDIIHSNYTDADKKNKVSHILKKYGKNSDKTGNLASSLITQASMDISFKNLNDVILNPQSTLQRIGRCNRWAENESGNINFIETIGNKESSASDSAVIRNLYDLDLHKLWVTELKKYDGTDLSLDDIYGIYNSFNKNNERILENYYNNLINSNEKILKVFYPKKSKKYDDSDVLVISKSNNLRNKYESFFYICEDTNGEWHNVLQYTPSRNFKEGDTFKEDYYKLSTSLSRIIERNKLKNLYNGYNKYNNHYNVTVDRLRASSNTSEAPYIRLDVIYDNVLGIIDRD